MPALMPTIFAPWFSLQEGEDSGSEIAGIDGRGFLQESAFDYIGPDFYMDVLQPVKSTPFLINHNSKNNSGVWNINFGEGMAIGVVPAFGGLVDAAQKSSIASKEQKWRHLQGKGRLEIQDILASSSPQKTPFVKKYRHDSELKRHISQCLDCQYQGSPQLQNHSKTALMAAYLNLMAANPPHALSGTLLTTGYFAPGVDSVVVTAHIANPDTHAIQVMGLVEDFDKTVSDTFPLFDDGNHSDGQPNDGVFGGAFVIGDGERNYRTSILTQSLNLGTRHLLQNVGVFTTIGPVFIDFLEITSSDTTAEPGDRLRLKIHLKNGGGSAVASTIQAQMISIDSCSIANTARTFGDIEPGETVTSFATYSVNFEEDCTDGQVARLAVNIASDIHIFWRDTVSIAMTPVGIENFQNIPSRYALEQNYPNPFNPETRISFSISKAGKTKLALYNILGQEINVLINEFLVPGKYEYVFDARNLPSGVYLYTLKSGNFNDVKKMILMR